MSRSVATQPLLALQLLMLLLPVAAIAAVYFYY